MSLGLLPRELLCYISTFLSLRDLGRLRCCNAQFALFLDAKIWKKERWMRKTRCCVSLKPSSWDLKEWYQWTTQRIFFMFKKYQLRFTGDYPWYVTGPMIVDLSRVTYIFEIHMRGEKLMDTIIWKAPIKVLRCLSEFREGYKKSYLVLDTQERICILKGKQITVLHTDVIGATFVRSEHIAYWGVLVIVTRTSMKYVDSCMLAPDLSQRWHIIPLSCGTMTSIGVCRLPDVFIVEFLSEQGHHRITIMKERYKIRKLLSNIIHITNDDHGLLLLDENGSVYRRDKRHQRSVTMGQMILINGVAQIRVNGVTTCVRGLQHKHFGQLYVALS